MSRYSKCSIDPGGVLPDPTRCHHCLKRVLFGALADTFGLKRGLPSRCLNESTAVIKRPREGVRVSEIAVLRVGPINVDSRY